MKNFFSKLERPLYFFSFIFSSLSFSEPPILPDLDEDSYKYEKLDYDYKIDAHTPDLMGDKLDYSSGTVRFENVDIDIPGNSSLKVELRRYLNTAQSSTSERSAFHIWETLSPLSNFAPAGNNYREHYQTWHFDTPRISMRIIESQISGLGGKYCTNTKDLGELSSHYQLFIPGRSSEHLIRNIGALPGGEHAEYVTKSKWLINCKSLSGKEYFEAVSPQGVTYTFDKQVSSAPIDYLMQAFYYDRPVVRLMFLVSKVHDRFGNWVKYDYKNGELSSIYSNDGRRIDVRRTADGAVATANGRSWTYKQVNNTYKVILPDGRFWSYNAFLDQSKQKAVKFGRNTELGNLAYEQGCEFDGFEGNYSSVTTSTIGVSHLNQYPYRYNKPTDWWRYSYMRESYIEVRHPDGALGKFWLGTTRQGQVDTEEFPPPAGSTATTHNRNPKCIFEPSLIKKSIEYNANKAYSWHYQYSNKVGTSNKQNASDPAYQASYLSNVHVPDFYFFSSRTNKALKVVQPDGSYLIHYINRDYESAMQNKKVATAYFDQDHNLLKEELEQWSMGTRWGDVPQAANWYFSPKTQLYDPVLNEYRTILYDSGKPTNYYRRYSNRDNFDMPQSIELFSAVGNPIVYGAIYEGELWHRKRFYRLSYYNDKNNWVLSQPLKAYMDFERIYEHDLVNLTPVQEFIYHSSGSYAGKSLVYEERRFGTWVKRHTSYHADGNVKRIEYNQKLRNENGLSSNYRFKEQLNYKRGQAQTIKYPARYADNGTVTQYRVIDNNGWVTSITDAKGATTRFTHNAMGRITSKDLPSDVSNNWLDSFFSWNYDSGYLTFTESRCRLNTSKTGCSSGELFRETISYDGMLRPVTTTHSDISKSKDLHKYSLFTWNNQKQFESYWSHSTRESKGVTYTYDGLQRLETKTTTGLGQVRHDYLSGNRIQITDGKGNQTTTTYEAYDTPDYSTALKIISPENVKTDIKIDKYGLVTSITQSGPDDQNGTLSQTEHRYYDERKRLCLVTRKDIGAKAYAKNALGETMWSAEGLNANLTSCLSAKPTTSTDYTFDNHGQIWKVNYADQSPDREYYRDNNGNITSLTAGKVSHLYMYNNLDLLVHENFSIENDLSLFLDYDYTNLGHRSAITYPDDATVEFSPNAFGQATGVKRRAAGKFDAFTYAENVLYHASGLISSFNYGNGITHRLTLKHNLMPDILEDANGQNTIIKYGYSYDNNLNLTKLIDHTNSAFSLTDLKYDGLDRLVSTTGGSGIGNSAIRYDGLGNIRHYTSKNSELVYHYSNGSNMLDSVSGTGSDSKSYPYFHYDSRGNVTNNSHRSFIYNRANQLVSSGNNSYLYDGFSRRVRSQEAQGDSYSFYNQEGRLLYRQSASGGVKYIYLGNKLIAKDGNNVSPNKGKRHYRPFGASITDEVDDIGYTGHKFDTELGLSYMQARYYDPVIGRFYSNDPVDTLGHFEAGNGAFGFNRYAYANNNPYKYVDPDGQIVQFAIVAAGRCAASSACRKVVIKASKEAINYIKKGGKRNRHTDRHITKKNYDKKSKFKKPSEMDKLSEKTVKKPDRIQDQGDRVRVEKDFNKEIGTKGEKTNVTVIDKKTGDRVTQFPKKPDNL
ncbi:RHS repeat domain-containing protein [Pseudoalteromonas sp. PPB1]|uniref:RHS repeat domain-containing protein n=1 Tax=Pseudoalteromonas sp. PPB1 TaxID=2756136 RepID=UPI00189168AF|nr:RHS repeat-associated core domain-containing protein [Pseudoalteromonas sp. PPB1]